jgi:hypothetical protein
MERGRYGRYRDRTDEVDEQLKLCPDAAGWKTDRR